VFAYLAYNSLKPDNMAAKYQAGAGTVAAVAAPGQAGAVPGQDSAEEKPRFRDDADYAKQHLPRFATMPWTARIFDDRQASADPQVFCMSSNPGPDAAGNDVEHTCTCLTEQGSYYEMELHTCRHVARRGQPYNPYRERRDQQQQVPVQPAQPLVQGGAPMVPGVVVGRRKQAMGTFPESPSYTTSTATPPTTTL